MNGIGTYPPNAFGPETCLVEGSFMTNGSTTGALDPVVNTFRAGRGLAKFTVSYSGAGVYVVTLPAGFGFPSLPYTVRCTPQAAVLATDWFDCYPAGEVTITPTTSFSIQCHRSGTANQPAATAGNRINFSINISNSTGK